MAEASLKIFLQRLDSLLLHEANIFSGLEGEIEWTRNSLREIGGNICCTEGAAAVHNWVKKLRDLINDMDDRFDEFIIQMDKQHGCDGTALTDSFTNELQKMNSCLAETAKKIKELNENPHGIQGQLTEVSASVTIKGEEDNNENPHGKEGQSIELGDSVTIKGEKEDNMKNTRGMEGETSASSDSFPFKLNYTNLPYYLKYCLMYCCIFPENYWIPKGRFIRLLVAEGLIQENVGKIMEDVAEENINELVSQGMLQVKDEHPGSGTKLTVPSPYREFSLHDMKEENFVASSISSESNIPDAARRVFVISNIMKAAPNLNNIRSRSLFLLGNQGLSEEKGNLLNFLGAKFLRVLDLEESKIKTLPDEVGDLIHLTYLGLKMTDINELPERLGDLRALQTLDIRWCGISALPNGVLNLVRLRHLKMFKNRDVSGVKLPAGIGRLSNLLTLTGVHAGGSIARELGSLTQLRRLGVMDVAEDNISEVSASIMKMQGLLCLSLEAKHTLNQGNLVLLDSFSPPPLLRKLRLEGLLVKIPYWLGLMERLTNIRLGFSHLSENPTLVLQRLPNLKILTLWHAYDTKQLGKEFCRADGFPKLESLSIASHVLEEWTELEEGALPSLKYLHMHNCLRLRMLPDGLQLITTLEKLDLLPLLGDLEEKLKPDGGEENYKIRNIPRISFIPMSKLQMRS